jgi:uncharacterized protein
MVAALVGVRVVEAVTFEGHRPEYRRNGPDRCFHRKHELVGRISDEIVNRHGLAAVTYGENADDASRLDRPAPRAAIAHRVLRPLAEAGVDKAMVRRIARALELAPADLPRVARRRCARRRGGRQRGGLTVRDAGPGRRPVGGVHPPAHRRRGAA